MRDFIYKHFPLKLDLQTFAEGAEGDSSSGINDGNGNGQGEIEKGSQDQNGSEKTFTQEDLNKILSDRLAKERAKWEKDFQTKLQEAKTEAEKLAKMNAEQKAEYERQKREEELARRESEITRRELRATALETLAEKGLPKTLADILNYTDAESTNNSIEAVEKAFREAVEAAVNERLKGTPPSKGGGGAISNLPDADKIKEIFLQR